MAQKTAISWASGGTANFWRGCSHARWADENGKEHVFEVCARSCYAENMVDNKDGKQRFSLGLDLPIWGEGKSAVRIMGKGIWNDVRRWNRQADAEMSGRYTYAQPQRPRVFVMSLGDFFEDFDGPVVDHKGNRLAVNREDCNNPPWYNNSKEAFGETGERYGFKEATIADLRRDAFKLIDECQSLDFLILTKRPQNIQRFWELRDWQKESDSFEKMGLPRNVAGDLAATDDGIR